MDSAFLVLFLLLAVFSGFNCLLNALISLKLKSRPKISLRIQLWLQSEPFSAV
jgi:hypothetical protein